MKDLNSSIKVDQSGIVDNTILAHDLIRWAEKAKPGKYQVKIYEDKSKEQRDYLHGIVFPFIAKVYNDMNQDILTAEQIGDYLKGRFCPSEDYRIVNPKTRQAINKTKRKSTEKLTKAQYSEFIENVNKWCFTFLGCEIPEAEK